MREKLGCKEKRSTESREKKKVRRAHPSAAGRKMPSKGGTFGLHQDRKRERWSEVGPARKKKMRKSEGPAAGF